MLCLGRADPNTCLSCVRAACGLAQCVPGSVSCHSPLKARDELLRSR